MAAGVVAIAADTSETSRLIRNFENGLLVSLDPGEIISAVQRILDSPEEARRIAENGRHTVVADYSASRWGSETFELLKSVICRRRGLEQD